MARNSNGEMSLLANLATANAVANSTTVNNTMTDVANEITKSINRDGTMPYAGNQPMGGYKLTGLGAGSSANDSARLQQAQMCAESHATSVTGSADALVLGFSPAFTTFTNNMYFRWTSIGGNTVVAPTANIGPGAKTIKKGSGVDLAVGDTGSAGYICEAVYNGTDIILLNPSTTATYSAASTTETLTGTDSTKFLTADGLAALWGKGSDIASASTVTIGEGGYFHITGTTSITDIDWTTAQDARPATVIFDGILTLTHNGTTLKLPGGANITTAAGDRACFIQDSSDNVICLWYTKASGAPVLDSSGGATVLLDATSLGSSASYVINNTTITQAYKRFEIIIENASHNSAGTSQTLLLEISGNNGTGYSSTYIVSSSQAGAGSITQILEIMNASVTTGTRIIKATGITQGVDGITTRSITTGYINAIRLTWASAASFDGGTITLIGYK